MSSPKLSKPFLLNAQAERLKKARSMKDPSLARREFFARINEAGYGEKDLTRIEKAVRLLEEGLYAPAKKNYSAHPLRVASYLVSYEPALESDVLVLALLHNILEMAQTLPDHVKSRFGDWVHKGCLGLQVDRVRQKNDAAYLRNFYEQFKKDRRLLLIKIFDKWDNLLSLYFNPSEIIREGYMKEIETQLLPIIGPQEAGLKASLLAVLEETRTGAPVTLEAYLDLKEGC